MRGTFAVIALLAVESVMAAVAKVEPARSPGQGVMPAETERTVYSIARQTAKEERVGAGWTPFMFGLFTPAQIPARDYDVVGLRVNLLVGSCCNLDGFDIGVLGLVDNHAKGWQLNVVSATSGDGVGLQTGGVNWLDGRFNGVQFGIANWTGHGSCCQLGVLNTARRMVGAQIGLVNVADGLQGMQFGLVNVIQKSDVTFLPFVNWYF